MTNIALNRIFIGLAVLSAAPLSAQPSTAPDAASRVAQSMAPRQQFSGFLRRTLETTTTGQMIVAKVGRPKADAIFAAEIERVVGKYGGEWESNLAASYREALTPTELSSAEAAFAARDGSAMQPLMMKVGPLMAAKSTDLLKRASLDAIAAAYAAAQRP